MAIKKNETSELKMEILEECGACTPRKNGDTVKIRYISWNNYPAKYDIRAWSVDEKTGEERCVKGNGFTGEELEELYHLIGKLMEEED